MTKIKIKNIAVNTFEKRDGSGKLTIITVLTEDDKKIKAWQSRWTDENLKIGAEVEIETTVKKDRDGFDELWIQVPKIGRQFTRNILPEAYLVAIEWMKARGEDMTPEQLDNWAAYFREKFTMSPPGNLPHSEKSTAEIPF